MIRDSKYGWGSQRKYSGQAKVVKPVVSKSYKAELLAFMEYVESKNSHSRIRLLDQLKVLGLSKSGLYKTIDGGTKTVGKNVLKGIVLYALIERMK